MNEQLSDNDFSIPFSLSVITLIIKKTDSYTNFTKKIELTDLPRNNSHRRISKRHKHLARKQNSSILHKTHAKMRLELQNVGIEPFTNFTSGPRWAFGSYLWKSSKCRTVAFGFWKFCGRSRESLWLHSDLPTGSSGANKWS